MGMSSNCTLYIKLNIQVFKARRKLNVGDWENNVNHFYDISSSLSVEFNFG